MLPRAGTARSRLGAAARVPCGRFVPRWRKEIVTVCVSQANDCAYDVAGHLMFLRLAGGEHIADDLELGKAPADQDLAALAGWARHGGIPPFSVRDAPEYVGTALALHFINRLVLVLLKNDLLPGSLREGDPAPFDGAPIARALEHERTPGESLTLLGDVPSEGSPGGPVTAPSARLTQHCGTPLSEDGVC
jgi:AhpD family alkylhydroperoxidase